MGNKKKNNNKNSGKPGNNKKLKKDSMGNSASTQVKTKPFKAFDEVEIEPAILNEAKKMGIAGEMENVGFQTRAGDADDETGFRKFETSSGKQAKTSPYYHELDKWDDVETPEEFINRRNPKAKVRIKTANEFSKVSANPGNSGNPNSTSEQGKFPAPGLGREKDQEQMDQYSSRKFDLEDYQTEEMIREISDLLRSSEFKNLVKRGSKAYLTINLKIKEGGEDKDKWAKDKYYSQPRDMEQGYPLFQRNQEDLGVLSRPLPREEYAYNIGNRWDNRLGGFGQAEEDRDLEYGFSLTEEPPERHYGSDWARYRSREQYPSDFEDRGMSDLDIEKPSVHVKEPDYFDRIKKTRNKIGINPPHRYGVAWNERAYRGSTGSRRDYLHEPEEIGADVPKKKSPKTHSKQDR